MNELAQKITLGVGSAAASAAIFAPLDYKWKGVLTTVAACSILSGIFGLSPRQEIHELTQ
ncbi:MAG: hypothetical protein ACRD28_10790 [Acidobacteriaceae bacterium]